jgi:PAS domain S-box-containing protein
VAHSTTQGSLATSGPSPTELSPTDVSDRDADRGYRALVQGIRHFAVFSLDPEGRILTWNSGAEGMTGYPAAEVVGRGHELLYPPEEVSRGLPARELADAVATGRRRSSQPRMHRDGTKFRAEVSISPLYDGDGELVGFAQVARRLDRSEQEEDRFRLLVQGVLDYGILMLDPKGFIVSWNEGAQRINGYAAEEILGRHFSVFYPPEDVVAGKPAHELEVASRDGRFEEEGWRRRKDGTPFWANVVVTAVRDGLGSLVGFAKVTRDLTERRRQQEALRSSEERFSLLVSGVRDYGIFMLDPGGHIASWNDGAQRIKGYRADEIIGKHFSVFYPDEDNAAGKPAWELEVAEREGRFEDEGWRLRKDGTRFWANVIITALFSDGVLVGFGKVTRDLTERREAEQQALEAARRAAEAEATSRAKSEFLATLSHELRTPLNAIGGYAELLSLEMQGPVTEGQKEYLERIRRSQQHLLSVINDLLNYSRIEAGALAYEVTPVPLEEVLDGVTGMVEPQAVSKGIALHREIHTPGLTALADRLKTEQILLNLLSNATKFTGAGGVITVTCEGVGDHAILRVSDTGIGIPPEKLEDVFEPFVQVGRSLMTPREGTGLGLSISRELARGMGGELNAESEPGRGSTFSLLLRRG